MGWTGIYMEERPKNYREFFEGEGLQFLDFARKGNTCYTIAKTTKGDWFGLVILTKFTDGEFIFKYVDEGMGPNETQAPKRLIKKLNEVSVPSNDYAREWREACLANNKKTLAHGMVIKFEYPMTFTHGYGQEDTFKVVKYGRAVRFIMMGKGSLVRITNWRKRNYTILKEPENA